MRKDCFLFALASGPWHRPSLVLQNVAGGRASGGSWATGEIKERHISARSHGPGHTPPSAQQVCKGKSCLSLVHGGEKGQGVNVSLAFPRSQFSLRQIKSPPNPPHTPVGLNHRGPTGSPLATGSQPYSGQVGDTQKQEEEPAPQGAANQLGCTRGPRAGPHCPGRGPASPGQQNHEAQGKSWEGGNLGKRLRFGPDMGVTVSFFICFLYV